jgi:hypothetical protein
MWRLVVQAPDTQNAQYVYVSRLKIVGCGYFMFCYFVSIGFSRLI